MPNLSIEFTPQVEKQVSELLLSSGFKPHLKGYRCVLVAVELMCKDFELLYQVTKELYPAIAAKTSTKTRINSWQRAERNIRHSIEYAWDKTKLKNIGRWTDRKPTNAEFLGMLMERLQMGKRNVRSFKSLVS